MKTLFIEGDLKNAYVEAYKAINESDKDVSMAIDSLVSFCYSFNGKIDEAVEGYQEAKAIFEEMKDFFSDEYTQALIDEVIEGLTVRVTTLRNLSIWFNNCISLIRKQKEYFTYDTFIDAF